MAKIKESKGGKWVLSLDETEMRAMASMIRLEMGSGWADLPDNPNIVAAGERLLTEINRVW